MVKKLLCATRFGIGAKIIEIESIFQKGLPSFTITVLAGKSIQEARQRVIGALSNSNFENPNVEVDPQDLSYVIYTSGSTGLPKGVLLNQVGFANMAKAMTLKLDYLKEGNNHCLVSVTSTPFDIFVYEIFVSLTSCVKLYDI